MPDNNLHGGRGRQNEPCQIDPRSGRLPVEQPRQFFPSAPAPHLSAQSNRSRRARFPANQHVAVNQLFNAMLFEARQMSAVHIGAAVC